MSDKLGNSLGFVISSEDDTTSGYEHIYECFDILNDDDEETGYMSCKIIIPHSKNKVSLEFSVIKNMPPYYLMDRTQVINEIDRRENDDNEKKVCPTCASFIL